MGSRQLADAARNMIFFKSETQRGMSGNSATKRPCQLEINIKSHIASPKKLVIFALQ